MWLFEWIRFIFVLVGGLSLLTWLVPQIYQSFFTKEQDLKKKYNAQWALVTGSSGGIGRAICEKLAAQGFNIVLVALDDDLHRNLHQRLTQQYPKQEFRAIGVDLGRDGYMDTIIKATEDIDIQLVFNNAGFVIIGLFADLPLERQMKNIEVNCMCAFKITHHFVNKMIAKKMRGAVIFTSSPAGQMPSPFALVYGSTKAFLTEFAVSLAAEVKDHNIDVFAIHPSPVDTGFYNTDTAHNSSILLFAQKASYSPVKIASCIFCCVGNFTVVYDQGYWTLGQKFLTKLLDSNAFGLITSYAGPYTSEYKKLSRDKERTNKTK
jgi:short-subunit dehydrogenase